jgi:hypothetical protein
VPATPVVLTQEKAYSESVNSTAALYERDIRRLVSYIAGDEKNNYDVTLAWPLCDSVNDDN